MRTNPSLQQAVTLGERTREPRNLLPLLPGPVRTRSPNSALADEDQLVTQEQPLLQEDGMERRQFLSIAAITPLLANPNTTRAHMDAGLRRVLPSADVEHLWNLTEAHAAAYGRIPPALLGDSLFHQ